MLILRRQLQTADGGAPQTPPTPATTHYSEVADKVSEMLVAAIQELGPLERPHATTRDIVRASVGVDVKFVAAVIAAIESVPELQALKAKFDVAAAHDTLQLLDAFYPVVAKLEVLARELRFTLDAHKAKVVWDARQIYAVSKRFALDPMSEVGTHVGVMKRALHPRRNRTKTGTPPTPSTPDESQKKEVPAP